MIKINLVPHGESESQYWYLPEVLTAIFIFAISWYGVQIYLEEIQVKVDAAQVNKGTLEANLNTITQETARYDQLDKDIGTLRIKLSSLKNITSSKIRKYKQIIVLEHLQNLKPKGVWFNYISETTGIQRVTIVGKAFDSILIAEFMSAIQATQTQEADPTDLRTQIYFSSVTLEKVTSGDGAGGRAAAAPADSAIGINAGIVVKAENAEGFMGRGDGDFPELKKFPAFQLTIKYEERKATPGKMIARQ